MYLSTILGAWIADRLLGAERVLFLSAIVIVAGHVALALLPGFVGVGVGLILVAIGSGGLKATATAVVGTLYSADDTRRDGGFSLFYLGINLGAFLGPLLTGLLQSTIDFHWGFGLAAVGMTAGLVQYSFGRRALPDEARKVSNPLPRRGYPLVGGIAAAAVVVIVVLVLTGIIRADNLALVVIITVIAATIELTPPGRTIGMLSGSSCSRHPLLSTPPTTRRSSVTTVRTATRRSRCCTAWLPSAIQGSMCARRPCRHRRTGRALTTERVRRPIRLRTRTSRDTPSASWPVPARSSAAARQPNRSRGSAVTPRKSKSGTPSCALSALREHALVDLDHRGRAR